MQSPLNQIYGLLIIFWSTLVTESWKRKEVFLADKWLMRNFFDPTLEQPSFKPRYDIDEETRTVVRRPQVRSYFRLLLIGLPVTVAFCALVIYCVMATQIAYDKKYDKMDKIPFYASFIPSVALTAYITIFSAIFKPLAEWLTNYEDHQWVASHENSLIMKLIMFHFVNSYIANFVFAYYNRDFMLLSKNVITIMIFT